MMPQSPTNLAGKVARAGDNQTNQTVTADSIGAVPLTVTNLAGASTNLVEFKGAGASSAISRGLVCLRWADDGFLNCACSILIPQPASPPTIRDTSAVQR